MDSAAHGPHQPTPASGKPDAEAAACARKPVLLARLDRLGTLAMDLAERTQVLAMRATDRDIAALEAAPPDSPALPAESNGPVLSFARASRVARDCIAMELRIAAGDAADDDASDRRISPAARRRLTAMKNEVRGQVEGSIRAHAEPLLVDRLLLDLDERLDDPDVEAEFGVLTIGQMVLSVCRDLHVKPEMRLMAGRHAANRDFRALRHADAAARGGPSRHDQGHGGGPHGREAADRRHRLARRAAGDRPAAVVEPAATAIAGNRRRANRCATATPAPIRPRHKGGRRVRLSHGEGGRLTAFPRPPPPAPPHKGGGEILPAFPHGLRGGSVGARMSALRGVAQVSYARACATRRASLCGRAKVAERSARPWHSISPANRILTPASISGRCARRASRRRWPSTMCCWCPPIRQVLPGATDTADAPDPQHRR